MAHAAERERTSKAVLATLNYLIAMDEKPVTYLSPPGDRPANRAARFESHEVSIRDGRPEADRFSLEREGFALLRHETAVADFYDEDEVRRVYYPEIERLVKEQTGASKVLVFDHTLRTNDQKTRTERQVREPVRVAHNDYTERSALQRVRDLLPPDEAEERLRHRFAVIQVWRPIGKPVQESPLAICDARSIARGDFVATDLKYQDRTGEIFQITFNPDHRWYYFPHMARDEALIFKCFDSLTDGRARFSAHTAFDDPTSPPGALLRESIEMRTLAFFEDD